MDKLPRWADVVLVPLICLIIAFVFCGILIAAIGQSPLHAIWIMIDGAFGSTNGLGYTLYYATTIFCWLSPEKDLAGKVGIGGRTSKVAILRAVSAFSAALSMNRAFIWYSGAL